MRVACGEDLSSSHLNKVIDQEPPNPVCSQLLCTFEYLSFGM
jgi:hypothetical protein